MAGFRACLDAYWRDCRANAAVEFALLMPFLLLLIAGTIDLGLGFQEKVKLQSALNSGMQHVMQTQGADIATSRQVVAYGLGGNSAAEIEMQAFCRCAGKPVSCTASCASGLGRFAGGSVSMPYRTAIFAQDMSISANFEVYLGEVE
ncbi:MAG TPA: TadE/TadG family type IV pilus assembly protein [Devosia sp.]|nr:TadE/TadG family type IV pilus assembly protein [Devosia sp.]